MMQNTSHQKKFLACQVSGCIYAAVGCHLVCYKHGAPKSESAEPVKSEKAKRYG